MLYETHTPCEFPLVDFPPPPQICMHTGKYVFEALGSNISKHIPNKVSDWCKAVHGVCILSSVHVIDLCCYVRSLTSPCHLQSVGGGFPGRDRRRQPGGIGVGESSPPLRL